MNAEPDLSRYDDILAWIDELGRRDADLRAAWIGGSAATGGYDEHSDLDINVLAAPGTFVRVFDDLGRSLVDTFAPTSVWRLPDATYADGRQLFATFDGVPAPSSDRPGSSTSWCTSPPTSTATSTYAGTARRWSASTPTGWSSYATTTRPSCAAVPSETVDQIRQRRLVAEWLVNRAIARSHLPEAVSLYLRFALLPVIQLLRARDCPARHDYLFRYLHTDLLPEDAARIDTLLPGVERLRELSAECFAWQDDLLDGHAAG